MVDYFTDSLIIENKNQYMISNPKKFLAYAQMLSSDKQQCFDFAYDMSYGGKGQHRDYRSGGSIHRTKGQVFINTFQGKMGEFALYRYLVDNKIYPSAPDCQKFNLGKWDSFDLKCQNKKISIKTTKHYGNLLLLETKDWNDDGEYIPNREDNDCKYEYTVLARFSPDGEEIMKNNNLLYQKDEEIPHNIKEVLIDVFKSINWEYDFPGFIYYSELVKMIRDRNIIPKGAILNGKKPMDAENYYFQTGNMHNISELFLRPTKEDDGRENIRLKKTCPLCGKNLVRRDGPYSVFWGCTGFSLNGCKYTEHI